MTNEIKLDIQDWWSQNPMTYGSTHGQTTFEDGTYNIGTSDFFARIDTEFYSWNKPLHSHKPFDKLFPYEQYKNAKVLEVGCGLGTMLMNWAKNGAICTGVDLNPTSIAQSKRRFELLGLQADIQLEDANSLSFVNNTFDYAWSWGVLHHSPNIDKSIQELFRVIKPGAGYGIMLYNRSSLYQWYMTDYVEGFLHNEKHFLSALELNSRYGDGHKEEGNPYTWPVTKREGLQSLQPYSKDARVRVLGTDLDCVGKLLFPGFSNRIPKFMIKSLARRLGWSLWFYGTKDKD